MCLKYATHFHPFCVCFSNYVYVSFTNSYYRYTIIREGEQFEVGTEEIVVGDILEFKYGNTFPCDGLFIRGNDVAVSEASLTGESDNIKKNTNVNPFLYSGTQVEKICTCSISLQYSICIYMCILYMSNFCSLRMINWFV